MSMANLEARKRHRPYTDKEFALFAEYAEKRKAWAPAECAGGERCWVEKGPPSYCMTGTRGICLGCRGKIKEVLR